MAAYIPGRGGIGNLILPTTSKKPTNPAGPIKGPGLPTVNNGFYNTGKQNTNIVNNPSGTLKNEAVTKPTKATQVYNQNQASKAPVSAPTPSKGTGGGGGGGGYTGGGGGGTSTPAWTGPAWTPKLHSAEELAKLYGINIDQQVYANQLNAATDKYFRQLETQRRRSEQQAYDLLAENYELTRNDIKAKRQDALKNGMSSGQLAAQELATLFGNQTSAGEVTTDMLQTDYDLAQQEATTLEENYNLAYTMAQEALSNLANLSQQIYSIDTQRYAADAAGAAQIGAADISAYGQMAAANASASASRYATDRSAAVQERLASADYYKNYFDAMYEAQYRNQNKFYTNRN